MDDLENEINRSDAIIASLGMLKERRRYSSETSKLHSNHEQEIRHDNLDGRNLIVGNDELDGYNNEIKESCLDDILEETSIKVTAAQKAPETTKTTLKQARHTQEDICPHTVGSAHADLAAEIDSEIKNVSKVVGERLKRTLYLKEYQRQWENLAHHLARGWRILPHTCKNNECQCAPLITDGTKNVCIACGKLDNRQNDPDLKELSNSDHGIGVEVQLGKSDKHFVSVVSELKSECSISSRSGFESMTYNDFESKRHMVKQEIGKKMIEGWTLLDMSCPRCVMPMLADESGCYEICVSCGFIGEQKETRQDSEEIFMHTFPKIMNLATDWPQQSESSCSNDEVPLVGHLQTTTYSLSFEDKKSHSAATSWKMKDLPNNRQILGSQLIRDNKNVETNERESLEESHELLLHHEKQIIEGYSLESNQSSDEDEKHLALENDPVHTHQNLQSEILKEVRVVFDPLMKSQRLSNHKQELDDGEKEDPCSTKNSNETTMSIQSSETLDFSRSDREQACSQQADFEKDVDMSHIQEDMLYFPLNEYKCNKADQLPVKNEDMDCRKIYVGSDTVHPSPNEFCAQKYSQKILNGTETISHHGCTRHVNNDSEKNFNADNLSCSGKANIVESNMYEFCAENVSLDELQLKSAEDKITEHIVYGQDCAHQSCDNSIDLICAQNCPVANQTGVHHKVDLEQLGRSVHKRDCLPDIGKAEVKKGILIVSDKISSGGSIQMLDCASYETCDSSLPSLPPKSMQMSEEMFYNQTQNAIDREEKQNKKANKWDILENQNHVNEFGENTDKKRFGEKSDIIVDQAAKRFMENASHVPEPISNSEAIYTKEPNHGLDYKDHVIIQNRETDQVEQMRRFADHLTEEVTHEVKFDTYYGNDARGSHRSETTQKEKAYPYHCSKENDEISVCRTQLCENDDIVGKQEEMENNLEEHEPKFSKVVNYTDEYYGQSLPCKANVKNRLNTTGDHHQCSQHLLITLSKEEAAVEAHELPESERRDQAEPSRPLAKVEKKQEIVWSDNAIGIPDAINNQKGYFLHQLSPEILSTIESPSARIDHISRMDSVLHNINSSTPSPPMKTNSKTELSQKQSTQASKCTTSSLKSSSGWQQLGLHKKDYIVQQTSKSAKDEPVLQRTQPNCLAQWRASSKSSRIQETKCLQEEHIDIPSHYSKQSRLFSGSQNKELSQMIKASQSKTLNANRQMLVHRNQTKSLEPLTAIGQNETNARTLREIITQQKVPKRNLRVGNDPPAKQSYLSINSASDEYSTESRDSNIVSDENMSNAENIEAQVENEENHSMIEIYSEKETMTLEQNDQNLTVTIPSHFDLSDEDLIRNLIIAAISGRGDESSLVEFHPESGCASKGEEKATQFSHVTEDANKMLAVNTFIDEPSEVGMVNVPTRTSSPGEDVPSLKRNKKGWSSNLTIDTAASETYGFSSHLPTHFPSPGEDKPSRPNPFTSPNNSERNRSRSQRRPRVTPESFNRPRESVRTLMRTTMKMTISQSSKKEKRAERKYITRSYGSSSSLTSESSWLPQRTRDAFPAKLYKNIQARSPTKKVFVIGGPVKNDDKF